MRRTWRQIAALLLIALAPAALAAFFHPKRPAWRSGEVTLAVAEGWRDEALWLDARPRADYDRGHIPGALPLSEEAWDADLPAVMDAWNPARSVVVYCSSLSCQASGDVARRLRDDAEMPRVYVLHGGWEEWRRRHP